MSSRDEDTWQPDLRDRSTTVKRVEAIAFTPMAAPLRNQLITQAYGDLAEAMARVLGTESITWSALGVWASNEIGGYLDLPIPALGRTIARPFADGNRDVFADIGRAQAHFLATVGEAQLNGADVDEAWRTCRRLLRRNLIEPPGRVRGEVDRLWDSIADEPQDPQRPNNQVALIRGFGAYRASLDETDPDERARLILLGNLLLALHEQRHLSLPISMGFRSWLRSVLMPSKPLETYRNWINRDPKSWRLRVENWWIETATKRFISIALPDETIRVCDQMPAGTAPVPFTPGSPTQSHRTPMRPSTQRRRLRRRSRRRNRREREQRAQRNLARRAEQRPEPKTADDMLNRLWSQLEIDGRPATYWNSLRDRMAYISALFVEHQQADRWWRDRSTHQLHRPDPRPEFERELDQQMARMVLSAATVSAHASRPTPLSDSFLDDLRTRRCEPTPLDGEPSFDRLRDPAQRQELLASLEADLNTRFDTLSQPGGLLAPENCRRARALFEEWEVVIMMGLLFRSLPDAYAAADGVRVIGAASGLDTDAFRRSGETAQFVRDLLLLGEGWNGDGSFDRDGAVWDSMRGLRGVHSMVSVALTNKGWDHERFGQPLNQEDMLGTAISFVVPVFEMMSQLGIRVDDADRDAYLSFWLGIGHLLGTPIEAVTAPTADGARRPFTWDEAIGVATSIRRRHHRRSFEGVRLTEALIHGIADGFPRRFAWLAPGMMQALGNQEVNALLLAGYGPGRTRANLLAKGLRAGLAFPLTRGLTRWQVQSSGRRWLEPFLDAGASRPYRTPVKTRRAPAMAAITADYWPLG